MHASVRPLLATLASQEKDGLAAHALYTQLQLQRRPAAAGLIPDYREREPVRPSVAPFQPLPTMLLMSL